MATTVTIDRSYFETLLRRAEFHTTGRDLSTPLDLPVVTIPKVDHDNLLQAAKEYALLKNALYRGGIAQETLSVLIQGGDSGTLAANDDTSSDEFPSYPFRREHRAGPFSPDSASSTVPSSTQNTLKPWSGTQGRQGNFRHNSFNNDENSYFAPDGPAPDSWRVSTPMAGTPQYARQDQRSITLKNLADKVTHKDIVNVVRGGAVLDVYLRPTDRSANVSFVEGTAAQAFFVHAKRNDIYLHGKRAELMWSDRQFILPPHVASKLSAGGSRNLLIRNAQPDVTEQRIRDDLEHIHNLVVVEFSFSNKDALVSLNSVHNALFARTCLMSRGRYKGLRIDFYPDECAQPLPASPQQKKAVAKPAPKKSNTMVNRFQMLNMDGTEDETNSSGSAEELPKFAPKTWGTSAVAV